MPRPREFDRQEALQRALETFQEKGFEAASLQELVDRMGIGRASLYGTFGNKERLFGEAMDLYARESEARLLATLSSPGAPKLVLTRFFRQLVDHHAGPGARSCLMVKAALSTRCSDVGTARRLAASSEAMDGAFHVLLTRAKHVGQLRRHSPREGARFLTNTVQGLIVTARIRPDRRVLRGIARVALSLLDD